MACRDMLRAGLNCVEYKNGARHTLSDYAEMAIRTANKRAYLYGEGQKRQEWGIHTVVVNSRQGGCPRCARYVGKVFIDDVYSGGTKADGDYPLLSEAIKGGLFHPRCKDSTSTYFEGITNIQPMTDEEMAEMERREKLEQKESYYKNQAEKNRRIAEHSLDGENKRTYAHRADVFEEKAEKTASKMASYYSKNDWSKALPTSHSLQERESLVEYAKERGVKINGIRAFDGDTDLLKEQIDIISQLRQDFKLKPKITIGFGDLPEDDFAETSGTTIIFNKTVLRNRNISESNLSTGGFASSDIRLIGAHEMGHIVSRQYGEKGIEIARKTYYNIFKNYPTNSDLLGYLISEVSPYSVTAQIKPNEKKWNPKLFKELIPEIIGKWKTNTNGFSDMFVNLLMEVYHL